MKFLSRGWKKTAAAAAALLLLSSSMFALTGCAPGEAKSGASSSAAVQAEGQLKPGTAYVKRDPSVTYSVPEGVPCSCSI